MSVKVVSDILSGEDLCEWLGVEFGVMVVGGALCAGVGSGVGSELSASMAESKIASGGISILDNLVICWNKETLWRIKLYDIYRVLQWDVTTRKIL